VSHAVRGSGLIGDANRWIVRHHGITALRVEQPRSSGLDALADV
jgi:hypothetical protein